MITAHLAMFVLSGVVALSVSRQVGIYRHARRDRKPAHETVDDRHTAVVGPLSDDEVKNLRQRLR